MKKNEYGLFTTIAMIVGVVIGAGIFFKSDDILGYTGGNILLGIMIFIIAAIAIIFGCLTIAELAARNNEPGGIISYAEMCYGKTVSCAFGWFQTFLYFPTIIAVVSFFAAEYICMLFNVNPEIDILAVISGTIIIGIFIVNTLSAKFGGLFQNAATIIKLIPLFIIACIGMLYGKPSEAIISSIGASASGGFISAIVPIAFAYDGWITATSIGHEVKDAKRNLPKALVIAPVFILAVYIIYFVGISSFLGVDTILNQGNAHVYTAANMILGEAGAKLIITFVTISILGTLNGLSIALIRQPYSLAIRGMFPKSNIVSKMSKRFNMPLYAGLTALIVTLFWYIVHYMILKFGTSSGIDISEISVTITYLLYGLLYFKVLQLGIKKEIKSRIRGILNPILAMCGSIIILIGSIGNRLFWIYALICSIVIISSVIFWKRKENYIIN